MNYKQWFAHYDDPDAPSLRHAYAKAFLDGAVGDDECFADWCRAEYEVYAGNPGRYEVPYTGLLD